MKVRVAVGPGLFPIEVLPTDTVWTLKWKIYQDEDIWEYFHRFRTNLSFSLPPPDDQELTGKNVWNGWIRLDDCERSLKSYSIHEGSEIKCRKIREVTEGHHKCFSTLLDGLRKRKSHLSVIDGTPVSWVKHASIHTHEVRSIQLELVENETWYLKSLIYVEGVIHVMSSLKELDLSGNEEIGIEGWIHITQALETNTSLKTLDLHECSIKSDSAARLGQMLEKNSSLSTLNLNYNSEIGEEGWNAITKALENNTSLKTLDLCWCEIGSAVAIRIGEMLGKNSSLRKLGLSYNVAIGDEGCIRIAKALEINVSLKFLDLSYCEIGSVGAERISQMLEKNSSLETLDMRDNDGIGEEGCIRIAEALKKNSSLMNLQLSKCGVDSAQICHRIADLLERNRIGTSCKRSHSHEVKEQK